MIPRTPQSTPTYTLVPYPTRFRSAESGQSEPQLGGRQPGQPDKRLPGRQGTDPCAPETRAGFARLYFIVRRLQQWRNAGNGCVCRVEGRPARPGAVAGVGARVGEYPRQCTIAGGNDHRSEEHTSELQSLMRISYAVFCLKKKKTQKTISPDNRKHQHTTIS